MTSREAFERSFGRPRNFLQLSAEDQWRIDKELGILDWDGSDLELSQEDRQRIAQHYLQRNKNGNQKRSN